MVATALRRQFLMATLLSLTMSTPQDDRTLTPDHWEVEKTTHPRSHYGKPPVVQLPSGQRRTADVGSPSQSRRPRLVCPLTALPLQITLCGWLSGYGSVISTPAV